MTQRPGDATSLSLLERARGRDPSAWRLLVTLYGPLVAHWCRVGGLRGGEEDDVSQEVFLAISVELGGFESRRPGSFRAWVRGITRFKVIDHLRRRKARGAGGTTAMELAQLIPDPHADSDEEAAEIGGLYRRALDLIRAEFEERTWQAFWKTAVEGQPTDRVAAELGLAPVTIRVAKSRVLGRLRAEVAGLID